MQTSIDCVYCHSFFHLLGGVIQMNNCECKEKKRKKYNNKESKSRPKETRQKTEV